MLLAVAVVSSTYVVKVAVIVGFTGTFVGAMAAFRSIVPTINVPRSRGAGLLFLQLSINATAVIVIMTLKIKTFLFILVNNLVIHIEC
jgi:hypothetical protein